MKEREIAFLFVFIVGLTGLIYFLGASITGHVVQSMYCGDGECKELCDSDVDCFTGVCCDVGGYGICEDSCDKAYKLIPKIDANIDIENMPLVESPARVKSSRVIGYVGGLVIVLAFLTIFLHRKKH
ncbi:hypothetical protein HQ533_03430 [Candidatus Woesearchaeota archaeon]|nr:hypothetical protein [Candidatus Woesearchaeota archaeon]